MTFMLVLPHLSKKIGDDKMLLSLLLVLFFAWLILFVIFAIIRAVIKISLKLVLAFPVLGAIAILLIVAAIL